MEKVHDLQHEESLIKMLGFKLIEDSPNLWTIYDDKNYIVGYIKYKKLNDEEINGYEMLIDSYSITCKNLRKENNSGLNENFTIDYRRTTGDVDHIVLNCGENPFILFDSKNDGPMNFYINNGSFYFSYPSKTDNFDLKESVYYNTNPENKEYSYQIEYVDYDKKGNQKPPKVLFIEASSSQYQQYYGCITIHELLNNNKQMYEKNIYGYVEDMVVKHKMGIKTFQHFRYLINDILPFKEEIISSLIQNTKKDNKLAVFIPELKEVKKRSMYF